MLIRQIKQLDARTALAPDHDQREGSPPGPRQNRSSPSLIPPQRALPGDRGSGRSSATLFALVARQQRAALLEDREALGDVSQPGVYCAVAPRFDRGGSDSSAEPFHAIDLTPD